MRFNIRQRAIDLTLQMLGDPDTGFNACYEAIRADYDAPGCEIGWTLPSENLILGAINPEDLDKVRVTKWPALILSTDTAVRLQGKRFSPWAGEVVLNVDAYIRLRAIDDQAFDPQSVDMSGNYEKHTNCFEDAFLQAMSAGRPKLNDTGYTWLNYKSSRSQIGILGDGYVQQARLTLGFDVMLKPE